MSKSLLTESFQSPLMLELENITNTLKDLPIEDIKNFWNADKCRLDLLPYLAKNLGVKDFDQTWSEDYKRQVIKQALTIAKKKGTVASVKEVLASLGLNTSIKEWFDYEQTRGTARIEMSSGQENTKERLALISSKINKTKRLACTVIESFQSSLGQTVVVGTVLKTTKQHTIKGA